MKSRRLLHFTKAQIKTAVNLHLGGLEQMHADWLRLHQALLDLTVAARQTDPELLFAATDRAEMVLGLDVVQAEEVARSAQRMVKRHRKSLDKLGLRVAVRRRDRG